MTGNAHGGRRLRARRWLVGLVAAVALLVVGGALGGTATPAEHRAERAPEPSTPVTATPVVQRLADIRSGTCTVTVAALPVTLPPGAEGGIVTAVHVQPGSPIGAGAKVVDVSGRPVLALALPFPMYRTIAPYAEGPDVEALQLALRQIGLYDGEPTRIHDPATQRSVQRLYERAGAPVPSTGPEATARLAAANAAIDDLDAQLWSGASVPQHEIDAALAERHEARRAIGVVVPVGDLVAPPGGTIAAVEADVGAQIGPGEVIATVSGNEAKTTCTLPAGAASDVPAGSSAVLTLEGEAIPGVLGPLEPGEEGPRASFAPDRSIPARPGVRSGDLEVTVAATEGEVLTVPTVALRQGPEGTRVVVFAGSGRRSVPVETGLVAAGWVEVTGEELSVDDAVIISDEPA